MSAQPTLFEQFSPGRGEANQPSPASLPEKDICSNNHGGNVQSLEAHASVDAASLRIAIWKHLQKVGATTCDQVEKDLGLSHQTCSARFSELKRDGWIFPTGKTKPTRSGRQAMTFVAGVEIR
jgi:predicted transcriptional regulator